MYIIQPNSRQGRELVSRWGKKLIIIRHGHIVITGYKKGDNPQFEKYLSAWRKNLYKYELLGGFFVKSRDELRVPRGVSIDYIIRCFPEHTAIVDNDYYKYDKIDSTILVPPRSDIQIVAISHMLCAPPYEANAKYTQQFVTMDTGEGKTYTAIAVSTFLKGKYIVMVPTVTIAEQWVKKIPKHTSTKASQVLLVSGAKTCDEILEGKHTDKIAFVFISKTLGDYISKNPHTKVERMLEATRAKTKIIDEAHRNMKTVVALDCLSNFRFNYYLTATDARADVVEDAVFQRIFKNMPKTSGLKLQEESHINVLIRKYFWRVPAPVSAKINIPRVGLNVMLYERYLIEYGWREVSKELDVVLAWIDKKNTSNNKILILVSTIEGIEAVETHVKKKYPDKKVTIYHSKLSKEDKETFREGDIVIATDKSMGYGSDIKGVQFMVNLVTYSNKIGAKQFKGRLRAIPDHEVYYFELVNYGYNKTISQFVNREQHLRKSAKGSMIIFTN